MDEVNWQRKIHYKRQQLEALGNSMQRFSQRLIEFIKVLEEINDLIGEHHLLQQGDDDD